MFVYWLEIRNNLGMKGKTYIFLLQIFIMAFVQKEYWECPFCHEGQIEVLIRPTVYSMKRSAVRGGRKVSFHRVREEIVVLSESCPVCGKSREEIEKKWREEGII